MAKHVAINADQAQALISGKGGKPSAKGKKRRSEIQADTDLEDRMSEAVIKKAKKKTEIDVDTKVSAGDIRGVMSETIARVYEEIWPGIRVRDGQDEMPDVEIQEEAYILSLTMIVGNTVELPRKPLKIREHDMNKDIHFCKEHAL